MSITIALLFALAVLIFFLTYALVYAHRHRRGAGGINRPMTSTSRPPQPSSPSISKDREHPVVVREHASSAADSLSDSPSSDERTQSERQRRRFGGSR